MPSMLAPPTSIPTHLLRACLHHPRVTERVSSLVQVCFATLEELSTPILFTSSPLDPLQMLDTV